MSQPILMTSFQGLFNAALQDYEIQTGTVLFDHPFAKQLEACNSVDAITAILQEQAQIFRKFRGDDGKIMKSLKSSVNVLYTLSSSTVLGQGVSLVCPKLLIGIFSPNCYYTAISACECNIRWYRYPAFRTSAFRSHLHTP
jgi:hypothetical protein